MIDDMIQPQPGHDRVYMVPRLSGCLSERFLDMMNNFGSGGGFSCILEAIQSGEINDMLNLTIMGYMNTMISMSIALWHRDWLNEMGP